MNEDPRLILSARRPGGEDDGEPEMAAALADARNNRALAEWAANEAGVDRKFADSLRMVQPPAGLRDRILTGARVSRRSGGSERGWFERRAFGVLRYSELVAIAAIFVMLGVALVYNYFIQTPDERPWQLFAAAKAAEIEAGTVLIDHEDSQYASTAGWLGERAAPAMATLPAGLKTTPLFGCSTMKWNGKPMSITCFSLGAGKEAHLVCIDAQNIPDSLTAVPVWTEVGGYTTAQWTDDGKAYMLMGRVTRALLEPLIAARTAALAARRFYYFL